MALTPVLPGSIVRSGGVGPHPVLPGNQMLFQGDLRPILAGIVEAASAPSGPVNTLPPEVFGDTGLGDVLDGGSGGWTFTGVISYAYQWQRFSGVAWSDISGATADDYTITTSDLGKTLRLRVTATDDVGSGVAYSNEVSIPLMDGVIQFKTHKNDGVPFNLFQDTGASIPATVAGDDVKAWKSLDGAYTMVWPGGVGVPVLQFVGDVPVVRGVSNSRLVGTGWNLDPKTVVAGLMVANNTYQPILTGNYDATSGLGVYASTTAFNDWPANALLMLGDGYDITQVPRAIGEHTAFSSTELSVASWRFAQLRFDHADITTTVTAGTPSGPHADFVVCDGMQGDIVALYISEDNISNENTVILEQNIQSLIDYVNIPEAAKYVVVMAGNSLTAGYGLADPSTESLPAQLQAIIGDEYFVINLGVSSIQTPEITANMGVINGYATFQGWPWEKSIIVIWEATNHMALGGATPAQAEAALEVCCDAATAYDLKAVMTVLPRNGHGIDSPDRASVNGLIESNSSGYSDACYPVGSNPSIGGDNENNSTEFYSDGIHTNVFGVAIEAAGLAPYIVALAEA